LNWLKKAIQHQNSRTKNIRQMAPRAKGERTVSTSRNELVARRLVPISQA
jgi:hypothetical protein